MDQTALIRRPLRLNIFLEEIDMFKKLLLAALIFLFSVSMAVAGCIIPKDSGVMMFFSGGLSRTSPTIDRPVKEVDKQPTAELLTRFSANAGEDWTDGVVVLDEGYALYLLVHRGDLVGECDIIETEMQ